MVHESNQSNFKSEEKTKEYLKVEENQSICYNEEEDQISVEDLHKLRVGMEEKIVKGEHFEI